MNNIRRLLSSWTKPFHPIYLVLALFLFAQTAALIHSEVHHFHEHEAECDIYLGVENQTLDSVVPLSQPTLKNSFVSIAFIDISWLINETITAKARAPPLS